MSRRAWVVTGTLVAVALAFAWTMARTGVFRSSDELDRRAELLDGGVPEGWPFDGVDASVPDAGAAEAPDEGPSLALGGRASIALHDFTMSDQQGRQVLRVRHLTGSMDITALREGTYRVTGATVRGAHIKLYRDASGRLSIANALRDEPPTVRSALYLPPEKAPDEDAWLLEVGPIVVEDTFLTLGFTGKPVQFHIHHAKAAVRRGPDDDAPRIYIHDMRGVMVEPSPLPKPVRIAHATGVVRLEGSPMVDLTARTCLGGSELRARAVVPAKKRPVEMTVDSSGLAGALGRMGLKIAARHKEDKLRYAHGPVKVEGGLDCDGQPVGDAETRAEIREAKQEERQAIRDASTHHRDVPATSEESQRDDRGPGDPEPAETRHEKREERQDAREHKRDRDEG